MSLLLTLLFPITPAGSVKESFNPIALFPLNGILPSEPFFQFHETELGNAGIALHDSGLHPLSHPGSYALLVHVVLILCIFGLPANWFESVPHGTWLTPDNIVGGYEPILSSQLKLYAILSLFTGTGLALVVHW